MQHSSEVKNLGHQTGHGNSIFCWQNFLSIFFLSASTTVSHRMLRKKQESFPKAVWLEPHSSRGEKRPIA